MARRAELLSPQDMRNIRRWTEELLWKHRDELVKTMSESHRKRFEKQSADEQRRELPQIMAYKGRGSNALELVQTDEVQALADKLSPAAKEELTKTQDLAAQRKVIFGWIWSSIPRSGYWGPRHPSTFAEDGLTQFFKTLKPADRERLLKLPSEQMRVELRKLYFDDRERGGGGFDRGGPDGRHRDPGGPERFKGRGPRPPHEPGDRAAEEKPAEEKAKE